MSDQESAAAGPGGEQDLPELTEAEREALEQQMKEIRVEDLLAQTVASVLNLSARRLLKEDELDLDQARLGIDAVRALTDLLPDEVGAAVREPLSQLQMLYAQRSGEPPAGSSDADSGGSPGEGGGSGSGPSTGTGGGASGLWVPGR